MTFPRFAHAYLSLALIFALTILSSAIASAADTTGPRVTAAYTAWDAYYFYAAFEVNDTHVVSTNLTPNSQPQQDDDVEVFFDTAPSAKAKIRTPATFQMAVSAGGGSYYSVGDGTSVPKALTVFTYKYAQTVDGTLNNNSDLDTGYTIELAIPWDQLGLTGPPSPGTAWGFNAISRNRDSLSSPADSFYSLSPAVKSGEDVQDPSKWTRIEFADAATAAQSSSALVISPHVVTNFPIIDGVVRSGEWNLLTSYSFGATEIQSPAPTVAEEPNITQSPFSVPQPEPTPATQNTTPATQTAVVPEPQQPGTPEPPPVQDHTLQLPGGGQIRVGPPLAPEIPEVPPTPTEMPRSPDIETPPQFHAPPKPVGPKIDTSGSLALLKQDRVTQLLMATFYYVYSGSQLTRLFDQPMDSIGPAFGGNCVSWDEDQIKDARRSGIEVLLPVVDPSDPNALTGLSCIVQALKDLKDSGQDYPLLALRASGPDVEKSIFAFFDRVPSEFRAETVLPDKFGNGKAYIVIADTLPDTTLLKHDFHDRYNEPETLLVSTPDGKPGLTIATVSPGGIASDGSIKGRAQGQIYQSSWQTAYSSQPDWIIVESWNDYAHGTEVAASRQYGEQYADQTKITTVQNRGDNEWNLKVLSFSCPTTIVPKTLYTATLRIENDGSLPWRIGENYSLSYRWYKDGRLIDDSAPRLPISRDLFPGNSATFNVGILAQDSYGNPIEPGDYTLVFDMIQGQDRWFTYAGVIPLKIAITIAPTVTDSPVVLSSSLRSVLTTGTPQAVTLTFRNGSNATLDPSTTKITYKSGSNAGTANLVGDVAPGNIGTAAATVTVAAPDDGTGLGAVEWDIASPVGTSVWIEHPTIVSAQPGLSFTINDIPEHMKTGLSVTGRVAFKNITSEPWAPKTWRVGYRWYYLDGVPATVSSTPVPLKIALAPGAEEAVALSILAPRYPGRYKLVIEAVSPGGIAASILSLVPANELLPLFVWVEPSKDAATLPLDLSRFFTGNGAAFEGDSTGAGFDDSGSALPAEMFPPDATAQFDADPLLAGAPGPNYYPSGYYSSESGQLDSSNHRIAFRYATAGKQNFIAASGQVLPMPSGNYKAVHILAAVAGESGPVNEQFGIGYQESASVAGVSISNWSSHPGESAGTTALRLPYRLKAGAVDSSSPAILGDYTIPLDTSKHLHTFTLPADQHLRILAITLER